VNDIGQHNRLSISVGFPEPANPAQARRALFRPLGQRFEQIGADVQEFEHDKLNIVFIFNNLGLALVVHT
jgi:hypothetical protein